MFLNNIYFLNLILSWTLMICLESSTSFAELFINNLENPLFINNKIIRLLFLYAYTCTVYVTKSRWSRYGLYFYYLLRELSIFLHIFCFGYMFQTFYTLWVFKKLAQQVQVITFRVAFGVILLRSLIINKVKQCFNQNSTCYQVTA